MNDKLKNPKVAIGLAVGAGLLVVVAGWMLLVSPAKSKASDLQAQIATTQNEIQARKDAIAAKPKITVDVRSSDLFRLTKAVPGRADMPGIVLELNRLAGGTGVTFHGMTPSQPVTGQGYNIQPIAVVVHGRFGEVNTFLNKLRKLVTVRKGKLDASGRLFAIDGVQMGEAPNKKFPTVQATITLDAFVYAGGVVPGAETTPSNPSDTSSPSSSGAVAAGATP